MNFGKRFAAVARRANQEIEPVVSQREWVTIGLVAPRTLYPQERDYVRIANLSAVVLMYRQSAMTVAYFVKLGGDSPGSVIRLRSDRATIKPSD